MPRLLSLMVLMIMSLVGEVCCWVENFDAYHSFNSFTSLGSIRNAVTFSWVRTDRAGECFFFKLKLLPFSLVRDEKARVI